MSDLSGDDYKPKVERSPSYPFISLRKSVDRVSEFWEKHRREAARLVTVAPTWGYSHRSSGLLQTVGALKQYGLIEDSGSGDDRKIQLTDLARRIISDQRPGAKEAALKEAATKPRLFAEYGKWIRDRPSEAHCLSELELDRGFNPEAARTFLRSFFDTVEFAGLNNVAIAPEGITLGGSEDDEITRAVLDDITDQILGPIPRTQRPFNQRFKVEMTGDSLGVSAVLLSQDEVEKLIRILNANKELLSH